MKDIIILGMGSTRSDCPFDSEVWGVNTGYRQVQELNGRIDKLFIAHRGQEYDWVGDPIFDWDEMNGLVNKGLEIVSLFKVKQLKKITRIPFRTMYNKFGTNYFSDTIAYMVAYALHINTRKNGKGLLKLKEPMRLRFYGVDMQSQDEYSTERGGIEYFIAVAKTLGVSVWIHETSALMRTDSGQPYGFRKINWKKIDPHNIIELQKTPKGLKKMHKLGLIDADELAVMTEWLEKHAKENALIKES